MVALEDGQPKLLNLKQLLQAFIRHRQEVVTRRTVYELRKARERAHLLEGLGVALTNIDEVIAIIKGSKSPQEAKQKLQDRTWIPGAVESMLERAGAGACRPEGLPKEYGLHNSQYRLSQAQVDAILDLKLHRLTGLEQDKILSEYKILLTAIEDLLDILGNFERLMTVIREELAELKAEFGDERRTDIIESQLDLTIEDLIAEEDMVVTLSCEGYVKSQPISLYRAQRRGGRGKTATNLKAEDLIERIAISSSHATMLCFSNLGKLYWKKVYQFPQASRIARGRPINNILPLEAGEIITAMLPVKEYSEDHYVFMATRSGVVKKTSLQAFSRPRANGIRAINIDEGDRLIGVGLTDGQREIMLFSNSGKAVRFNEQDVRSMGRVSRGVRGIRLKDKQYVVSLIIVDSEHPQILTATEYGYGKRTLYEEYRRVNRGAQGVLSIQTSERNGEVVRAVAVNDHDDVMLITNGGVLVRTRAGEISLIGRNTQGVRLINLGDNETLVGLQRIDEPNNDVNEEGDTMSDIEFTPEGEEQEPGHHEEPGHHHEQPGHEEPGHEEPGHHEGEPGEDHEAPGHDDDL